MDDWTPHRSLARCNPMFHGKPRYDHILIQGQNALDAPEVWYARLCGLYTLRPDHVLSEHAIALVQYALPTNQVPSTDIGMKLLKYTADTTFIFVASIIRGVHMIPHSASRLPNLVFANDLTDPDIFLRLRKVSIPLLPDCFHALTASGTASRPTAK